MFKDKQKQVEYDNFILSIENSAGFFDPYIKLKSGRDGHYYFDIRNSYNSINTHEALARYVYEFAMENGLRPKVFLGVPQGAAATGRIATQFIDYYEDVPVPILRTESKGHGDPRDRSSIGHLNRGTPVVITEDVVTTGISSITHVLACQNAGLDILAFVAQVDRGEIRDGGMTVSDYFEKVLHLPFYAMTNAVRLLPRMYQRDKPPDHVARNVEEYVSKYCKYDLILRGD